MKGDCVMATNVAYGEGREALLRAVIAVTARHGLRGVTYRAVAEEAGVTHGLVRYHFHTRASLIREAFNYSVARSISEAGFAETDLELGEFLPTVANAVATDQETQAFQYELMLESRRRPELSDALDAFYGRYVSAVRDVLVAHDLHDEALARMICSCVDGAVLRQIAGGSAQETRESLSRLGHLLQLMIREASEH